MKIYIPIAEGQTVPPEVLNSIAMQTVPCTVVLCATPGTERSQRNYSELRRIGEAASRELCRARALATNDEYCIIQDRDMVHLYDDNVARMIMHLNTFPGHVAVACPCDRKLNHEHVRISAQMVRVNVLEKIRFTPVEHGCMCEQMQRQLRAIGQYDYLGTSTMVTEIDNP
jgi:hypothetical protein